MELRVLIPPSLSVQFYSNNQIVTNGQKLLQIKKEFGSTSDFDEPISSSTNEAVEPSTRGQEGDDNETTTSTTSEPDAEEDDDDESDDEEGGNSEIGSTRLDGPVRRNKRKATFKIKKDVRLGICANIPLRPGMQFGANEGEIQIVHVQKESMMPPLQAHDIRLLFGCVDRLLEQDNGGKKISVVKVCNWIRFLRTEEYTSRNEDSKSNVLGRFTEGRIEFNVTKEILKGEEMITAFDMQSLSTIHCKSNFQMVFPLPHPHHSMGVSSFDKKPDSLFKSIDTTAPLDLSSSGSPSIEANVSSSPSPVADEEQRRTFSSLTFPHRNRKRKRKDLTDDSEEEEQETESIKKEEERRKRSSSLFSITSFLQNQRQSKEEGNKTSSTTNFNNNNAAHLPFRTSPSMNGEFLRPILRTRGRERSLLPCEVCGKAFDRPSLLKRHMRTHTGEKPHICDVCSKGFSTSSSLNTHRRIHSGEKPHQCPVCGKRFTASSNLYYHRMTHNKEKPHKCLLCGKSFPTPGDLKSHQYVHSGSWPYNCPICHRGFSKQTNLRNHLLLHSGDKPHNCHICGKKFALACNLRAHLRTHEEEPISSCLTCKRAFLTSLNMLVNGHCRTCILSSKLKTEKIESATKRGDNGLSDDSGKEIRTQEEERRVVLNAPTRPSLSLPQISHHGFKIPMENSFCLPEPGQFGHGPNFGNMSHPSLGWSGGRLSSVHNEQPTIALATTYPFLEQLFQWNYKFAKETAGNLNLMQQRLLESQLLAAQLMIGSSGGGGAPPASTPREGGGPGPARGFSVADLLRASVHQNTQNQNLARTYNQMAFPLAISDPNDFFPMKLPIDLNNVNKIMPQ